MLVGHAYIRVTEEADVIVRLAFDGGLLQVRQYRKEGREANEGGAFAAPTPGREMPLGVFEEADYPEGDRSELRKGDVLVLFTDCVFEAANENREQFGKERIRDLLIANAGLPARDIIECMHSAVLDFVGAAPINDDFTMIVIWCLEDPPKRGGDAASVEATDDEGRDAEAVDEAVFDEE